MQPLQSKATIALISPASPVDVAEVAPGKAWLESRGYRVVESESLYSRERFLAGDDRVRAQEFTDAWCDPSIDAIVAVRGGYGSQRILPFIDWDAIKKHTKPFFGFSDITALQLALIAKAGKSSYSGFVLAGKEGENRDAFEAVLQEKIVPSSYRGGCLSLVQALVGTPYLPDFTDASLLLEDVGEKPYCIDRMLSSLELAGCFSLCREVVFGTFKDCISKDPADGTIEDVLRHWEKKIKKPVYFKPSYGHGAGEIITCQ